MPPTRRARPATAIITAILLLAVACTDDTSSTGLGDAAPTRLDVDGGVRQVAVRGAEPGAELLLVDGNDEPVTALYAPDAAPGRSGEVDDEGNLIFGRIESGSYRVVGGSEDEPTVSEPVDVLAVDDTPDQSFFDGQSLEEGLNYIEMRDGVTLAAMVRFPDDPLPGTPEGGPYPTVVEYSGYDPSNPDAPQPSTAFADAYGFATVGVNVRGSTCSGGELTFFEPAQVADGYDTIEAVAAQDWVMDNEVGMVGLSYPGISQLFVAEQSELERRDRCAATPVSRC